MSDGPVFEREVQLRSGHWSAYALPALVIAASAVLAVRDPSAYWMGPAALALLAVLANWRTRSTTTRAATLGWLGVLLCSSVGMLVLLTVPWNDGIPPF